MTKISYSACQASRPLEGPTKLHYDPETDSLYIKLSAAPGAETREIAEGVVADLSAEGALVGLDIDAASTRLDLTTLEAVALPLAATSSA